MGCGLKKTCFSKTANSTFYIELNQTGFSKLDIRSRCSFFSFCSVFYLHITRDFLSRNFNKPVNVFFIKKRKKKKKENSN